MYEQMVRDAARATGLGVWYIRYIAYYVVQTGCCRSVAGHLLIHREIEATPTGLRLLVELTSATTNT